MSNDSPTPDELEQQREADPDAETRAPDPERPDVGRTWLDEVAADELPGDVDPADLVEQERPLREWSHSDPDPDR